MYYVRSSISSGPQRLHGQVTLLLSIVPGISERTFVESHKDQSTATRYSDPDLRVPGIARRVNSS